MREKRQATRPRTEGGKNEQQSILLRLVRLLARAAARATLVSPGEPGKGRPNAANESNVNAK
jgi:hypothetical protein